MIYLIISDAHDAYLHSEFLETVNQPSDVTANPETSSQSVFSSDNILLDAAQMAGIPATLEVEPPTYAGDSNFCNFPTVSPTTFSDIDFLETLFTPPSSPVFVLLPSGSASVGVQTDSSSQIDESVQVCLQSNTQGNTSWSSLPILTTESGNSP
jgi:hypothetical protein